MAQKVACPTCGEMIDTRGLRLHLASETCKATAQKKSKRPQEQQNNNCEHEFRLLTNRELESVEEYGYTKVCIKCDELE